MALGVGHDVGLSATTLLEGSGLDASAVGSAETLTSIDQYLTVVRNLVRHYPGDDAGIRMGRRLPLSHYGMYSYAILCAATLRQACDIAIRYALLRGPMFDAEVEERAGTMTWIFRPRTEIAPADLGPRVFRTLLETQFMVCIVAMADVMRPECVPLGARCSLPAPAYADALARALGCPILFDQPVDELDYPRFWMDRAPRLASPLMAESACKTLDRQLKELKWSAGIARHVHEELTRTPGTFPTMEALACRLHMTSRHLRRKLEAQGTSYQAILASVRTAAAIDCLTASQLSTEDIASILGFSDAASFRNAFKRWTGKTPSQFRGASAAAAVGMPERNVSKSERAGA
jgi:AraC-like DNA-binding protein